MKETKFGTSLAIFILFFGLAMAEAVEKHNWIKAVLFLLLGIVSFRADTRKN
jgi:hypothetical protein